MTRTRRPRGRFLRLFVALAFAALAGTAWLIWGDGPSAKRGGATVVVLESGGGLRGIATSLSAAGVIRSRAVFMAFAVASGAAHRLKAGEYNIASGESLYRITEAIRLGQVVRHVVTIPEGLTSREAVDVLLRNDILTGPAPLPDEGSLLPETYEVRRGEPRQAVIDRMTAAQTALLDRLWPNRAPGLPYADREHAVIMASVIEKETGKDDERPRVAAVFVNRLKAGMRLESDPTVIYGVSRGAPLGRGLRASELARPTPYNTYLLPGLPPTPIANPGRAALEAALNPSASPDLYFVADGSGGHVFASTFEAHKRNVARWRQIEQGRSK